MECLTADGWVKLLEDAGLRKIAAKTYQVNARNEAKEIFRRYGCGGMLGVWGRILVLYVKSPAYRRFVREVREGGITPDNLEEYFGYGMFVGRK